MGANTPCAPRQSAKIPARPDPLRVSIWSAALGLMVVAAALRRPELVPAWRTTAEPFLTLAGVILASALANRLGLFGLLARLLVPEGASPRAGVAAVLGFTALLSALVNLDVAVVVAMPVTLRSARRSGLPGGWLSAAVAATANGTSFLLPTSNISNLLVLSRAPLPTVTYLRVSWLPWLLVTALTIGGLAAALGRHGTASASAVTDRTAVGPVLDLVPMFLAASAIRAVLGAGVDLRGSFVEQLAAGTVLASAANNLPAAVAVRVAGGAGRWAAILAMSIGPNLFITGSVATLICRRIARDGGTRLGLWRFSAMGLALVPAQLAAATVGLRFTGVLR